MLLLSKKKKKKKTLSALSLPLSCPFLSLSFSRGYPVGVAHVKKMRSITAASVSSVGRFKYIYIDQK